ncbi:MAG: exopolysaccharide biosynthesis polyprenyl glycosylphosphotransferase [Oscillospiraceae bacterium]|nr:exopolysaccharide biosynthesis polyprenyl glycosylphosphotransferase [Oscillospiraceae bacterium]
MRRNSRQLIFVGDTDSIYNLIRQLDTTRTTGLRLSGYYSDRRDDMLSMSLPYLGDYTELRRAMGENRQLAEDIYCTVVPSETDLINDIAEHCLLQTTRFYYLPPFLATFGYYLAPKIIGDQVVFTNFSEPLLHTGNRLIKRTFDIMVSLPVLLALLLLLLPIACIIKWQSPGPVFFRQRRTGLGGKDFSMYKFRSMHVNSAADTLQATKDDPRKFPFGNFMRRTNIDELPQFFNVFIGDMSIVGPRPHMLAHTEEYRHKISEYMIRHYVRPGITGWAQTTGYRGETRELWQMEDRVKRDIWYIQNWSFWLDVRIILRTAKSIIYPDKEAY